MTVLSVSVTKEISEWVMPVKYRFTLLYIIHHLTVVIKLLSFGLVRVKVHSSVDFGSLPTTVE